MTPHSWFIEDIDGGPLGPLDHWMCSRCGAHGGIPDILRKYRDENGNLCREVVRVQPRARFNDIESLSEDCDEALEQILRWKANNEKEV